LLGHFPVDGKQRAASVHQINPVEHGPFVGRNFDERGILVGNTVAGVLGGGLHFGGDALQAGGRGDGCDYNGREGKGDKEEAGVAHGPASVNWCSAGPTGRQGMCQAPYTGAAVGGGTIGEKIVQPGNDLR
jgi:hypothetical protein